MSLYLRTNKLISRAMISEIKATNELSNAYPDCKAVLTAGKNLGSSYTDDWGSRQRSEGRWFVGCKAIASTCKIGEKCI